MSHYTTVEVEFDGEHIEEMIAALEGVFGKGTVEYHEKGAALMGYAGDDRSLVPTTSPNYAPHCEVVIRRNNVGGSANDVGFKLQENGKFKAYISSYDTGRNFDKAKQHQAASSYALAVGEKMLKAKGFGQIEKVKMSDGSIKLIGRPDKIKVDTVKLKNW